MDHNHDISKRDSDLLDKQFLGVVEDANDPRKEGRAKIRVVSIHEEIPVEDLPWAYPKQKSAFFGKEGRGGSLSVPKKGAIVAVRFDNGNPYSPEYYSLHEIGEDVREELGKNGEYLGSHAILFDGDEELKIWFTISKGLTIQLKGSRINLARDKSITIEHADTQSIIELRGSNISVHANSTIDVTSGSEITVNSNAIWVSGNSVKVGRSTSPEGPAVLGDRLFALLKQLAGIIDAAGPTPGAASFLVNTAEATCLSKHVKIGW